jgi:hypothetical protein
MRALHLQGKTLNEIGIKFGVTRERVRQILTRLGVKRTDGGIAAQAQAKRYAREQERQKKRDARAMRRYGCSHAELMRLNEGKRLTDKTSFAAKFWSQKHCAQFTGIEWQFTFPEWVSVWRESGHWESRGRWTGYVMSRRGDTGPFAPWNVYITTASQNIKDGYVFRRLRKPDQVAA